MSSAAEIRRRKKADQMGAGHLPDGAGHVRSGESDASGSENEHRAGGKKKKNLLEEMTVKLRRKQSGEYKLVAPGTPFDEVDLSEIPFLRHSDSALGRRASYKIGAKREEPKTWKSWIFGRKFFFPFGIFLGVIIAAMTFTPLSSIPPEIADAIYADAGGKARGFNIGDVSKMFSSVSMPDWLTDFDFRDLTSNLSLVQEARQMWFSRDFQPGIELHEAKGLQIEHPVVLLPGIVSSGLESWSADNREGRSFFRKRLWGTSTMIQAVLSDKAKWIEAISLDPVTGLDPPNYKVRAAQGLDAASEFIQGYWVWRPIIENLGAIGGDLNNVDMAAYDWRLSYYNLEVRDAFFTKLKNKIEVYVKVHKKKAVMVTHSMGATVMMYFMKWVEADPAQDIDGMGFGGGGGPNWVEDHIESWVNIAGTLLGVTKALSAHLSGEMKDVVELHPAAAYLLEKVFSRKERAALFRSWAGSASMWPKGGERVWGDHDGAPDDLPHANDTFGRFFSFRDQQSIDGKNETTDSVVVDRDTVRPNLTMADAIDYVLTHTPPTFQRMMERNFSHGFTNDVETLKSNARDHRKWINPLEVQLPKAPSMKIFCLYGYGKETERSYWYSQGQYLSDDTQSEGDQQLIDMMEPGNDTSKEPGTMPRTPLDLPLAREHAIDIEVTNKDAMPSVRKGVVFEEAGDGTVPLLSLGAMCVKGWKDPRWNPSGVKVVTREFKHQPVAGSLRGGETTGDHIDLLGSSGVNEAVLQVAAGKGDEVEERFVSYIREAAERIKWD